MVRHHRTSHLQKCAASLCHYQLFHLAWLAQVRDGDTDLQVFWWVVQSGSRPNTGNDGNAQLALRLAGAKFLIIHKRPADFLTQRHILPHVPFLWHIFLVK